MARIASHHLDVGVTELACDELIRGAGAHGTNRVEMAGVAHPVMGKAEHAQPLAVDIADLPPEQPAEESLPRGESKSTGGANLL